MEKAQDIELIIGYLRGGQGVDVRKIAKENPEMLSRCITYLLNERYHRQNLIKAVINLLNYSPTVYKGIAWELIQKIPLSFLMELMRVLDKKDNTKRLRHAFTNKLATTSRKQIIRAYFMRPDAYRSLFQRLYLPRELFNDKEIVNENYKLAYKLSTLSLPKALIELNIGKSDLLRQFKLPLEQIMTLIESPEEAADLAKITRSDNFFRHSRWFKNILDETEYEKIALEKMEHMKNPMAFLSIRKHLEETDSLTPELFNRIEEKANEIFKEMMEKFNLERLALIVDISGSMQVAVEITQKLYEAFSKISNIIDLIAFNERAMIIDLNQLVNLKVGGSTSIGASIVLLKQRWDGRKLKVNKELKAENKNLLEDLIQEQIPQAIIMITDLEENARPGLNLSLKLLNEYGNPPLIILQVNSKHTLQIDYPHAIIAVSNFHKNLIMEIMKQIASATAKVAVKEKTMTEILVERKPIDEEISIIELDNRPEESFQKGYLEKVLCSNVKIVRIEEIEDILTSEMIDEAKLKRDKIERATLDKIKKMINVSNRIKLEMMRTMLEMDEDAFNERILDWAEEFGFVIDGEFLVLNTKTVGNFIDKLDTIIVQNELILEYTKKIEDVIDGIDNLEDFLVSKLGNDFNKIKHVWLKYKEGNASKGDLIKEGAKVIGKKFIKIFLKQI